MCIVALRLQDSFFDAIGLRLFANTMTELGGFHEWDGFANKVH